MTGEHAMLQMLSLVVQGWSISIGYDGKVDVRLCDPWGWTSGARVHTAPSFDVEPSIHPRDIGRAYQAAVGEHLRQCFVHTLTDGPGEAR